MNPLFSIIIPIYNVEAYLAECLDSVLNQNFDSCELICINDGSKDNSLSILENYAKKYSQIKILSQQNAGLSAARNAGLEIAKGEYILFLDSDDMFRAESLNRLKNILDKNNLDIVAFNSELYFSKEQKCEPNQLFNHDEVKNIDTGLNYFEDFVERRKWGPSAVCFYAFKKSLFEINNLKFELGLLHEDELFMPKVLYYTKNIFVLPHILYVYRMNELSITKKVNIKNYTDKLLIGESLFDFFEKKHIKNLYINRSIYNLLLSGIHGLMKENRKKITSHSKKIILKTAHTTKEKFVANLINLNLRIYMVYYSFVKK